MELLIQENIDLLVDVRLQPRSAIPGFSGGALRGALTRAGIEYQHARALGNPERNRDAFRDGRPDIGRAVFRRVLARGDPKEMIEHLARIAGKRRVAVLCAERDHARCHRQVIIERATELNPRVGVTVLA